MTGTSAGTSPAGPARDENGAHAELARAFDVVRQAVADHHRLRRPSRRPARSAASKMLGCGFM